MIMATFFEPKLFRNERFLVLKRSQLLIRLERLLILGILGRCQSCLVVVALDQLALDGRVRP